MLGKDYPSDLQRSLTTVAWQIELPAAMSGFFQETGTVPSIPGDERRAARLLCRTRCILIPEAPLPALPRQREPMGIYLNDISRYGAGFISPIQFFPEEQVRILLPTFWIRARVMRGRYLGPHCYQIGVQLISRHEPDASAFQLPTIASARQSALTVA